MPLIRNLNDGISVLRRWHRLAGTLAALEWFIIRSLQVMQIGEPASWRVRPRQVAHKLTARLRGSSDMRVFWQLFTFDEYSSLRDIPEVSVVLDLGANVGFSSAYFLSCFPRARVVAVEPDPQNTAICRINLRPYGERAMVVHGAVWSGTTSLRFKEDFTGQGLEWARKVTESPAGTTGDVEALDVSSLIRLSGAQHVDLLKVDIEGAELVVFGNGAEAWLPNIRNICIELHNDECRRVFFDALSGFNYETHVAGELTICRNIRRKNDCP